jgi:hypothetical protein
VQSIFTIFDTNNRVGETCCIPCWVIPYSYPRVAEALSWHGYPVSNT